MALEINVSTGKARREVEQLDRSIDDLDRGVRKNEVEINKYNRSLDSIGKSASMVRGAVAGMVAAFGAYAAAQTIRGMVDTAASFERMEVALKTITGSSKNAQKAMAWITEFTARTPYELAQVTEAFTRLEAQGLSATKNLGLLGDTASAMGKSLAQAVEMFADAVRGENERLKEFGIVAKTVGDEITYSWSEGGKNMQITAQKNAESITAALQKILSRFKGGMEEQSKTFSGMMSNLADSFTLFAKSVMDAGAFDFIKQQLRDLLQTISDLQSSGKLDDIANRLGGILKTAIEATTKAFKFFSDAVSAAWKILSAIPTGFLTFLDQAKQKTDEAKASIEAYGQATKGNLDASMTNWQKFVVFLNNLGKDIIAAFAFMGKSIGETFGLLVNQAGEYFALLATIAVESGKAIVEGFKHVGSAIWDALTLDFDSLQKEWSALMSVPTKFASKMVSAGDKLSSESEKNWTAFKSGIAKGFQELSDDLAHLPELVEPTEAAMNKATQGGMNFKSSADAIASTVSFLNGNLDELNNNLGGGGGKGGGIAGNANQAAKELQNLNYEYYKALAAARGLSDPEITYAEGMQAAAKRAQAIFDETAQKAQDANEEAATESARQWDLFASNVQKSTSDVFYDMWDNFSDGWQGVLDSVGDFFKRTFADLASWLVTQKFVMPVMAQVIGGLGGVMPAGAMQAMGMPTGGGFQIPGMGGMNVFGTPSWWNTPIFGGGSNPVGYWPGMPPSAAEGAMGGGFTWGNAITGIGGAFSMGMGINSLINGNLGAGIGGTIGGGMMMASMIPGLQILAPIGAAVSLLGNLLGGLFGNNVPEIDMRAGASYGSDLFNMEFNNMDISDADKTTIRNGVANYFDAWKQQFNLDWEEVFRSSGYEFKAEEWGDSLESVKDWAKWASDSLLKELGGYVSDQIFGTFIPGSRDFLTGLTGTDTYSMGEGELTALIEAMFTPLYALQQADVKVGQIFLDLRSYFGNADTNENAVAAQKELGEWFKSLQNSGEEISATVARVITTLGTVPEGMDRLAALVESGMNLEDAYKQLEKQLGLTQALLTEPVQNMVATAFQTLDFGQAKDALMTGIKQMMAQTIMASFTQDVMNSLIKSAFDPLGGLTDAIEQAIEDQDYSTLGDKFAAALDAIRPAIDELEPRFQDLFDMLEKLGIEVTNTANTIGTVIPSDPTGENKVRNAVDAMMASAMENASWSEAEKAFKDSLEKLVTDVAVQAFSDNLTQTIMGLITNVTTSTFPGGLQGLMEAFVGGEIDADQLRAKMDEIFEGLGPLMETLQPIVQEFLEAMGLMPDATEEAANSIEGLIKSYQDMISTGQEYVDRMNDLSKWREDEIAKIEDTGASGAELERALAALDDAYIAQADVIRDDLVQAIYEAEQATRDWVYTLTQSIDALTGGANAASIAFDAYEEALGRSRDESLSIDQRIAAIGDAKRYLDEYVNSTISSIEQTHQTRIDELNKERQTIQDNAQAEQQAIRDLYQGRIDALQAERDALQEASEARIDALQTERDALQEAADARVEALQAEKEAQQELFDAQIEAAQEQLDLAEAWGRALESIRGVMLSLGTGDLNPADQFEQLAIQQAEVDRLRGLYASSTGAERAAYGDELARAIQGELELANGAYLGPSGEYTKIYEQRMQELQDLQNEAVQNAVDTNAIQEHIESLNEQRNTMLEGIDQQIESEKDTLEAALKGIDQQIENERDTLQAALDGIDKQIEAERNGMEAALKAAQESNDALLAEIDRQIADEQAAMEREIADFKATMVPYYEALLEEGRALYEQQVDSLQRQLTLLEQIRDAILNQPVVINQVMEDSGTVSAGGANPPRNMIVEDSSTVTMATGAYVRYPMQAIVGDAPGGEWILRNSDMRELLTGGGSTRNGMKININLSQVINSSGEVDEGKLARLAGKEAVAQIQAYLKTPEARQHIQKISRGK